MCFIYFWFHFIVLLIINFIAHFLTLSLKSLHTEERHTQCLNKHMIVSGQTNLLHVEEKQQFNNLNHRKERREQHAQPAHTHTHTRAVTSSHHSQNVLRSTVRWWRMRLPGQSLSIDELQNVPRDIKHGFPLPLQSFLRKQPDRDKHTWFQCNS